VCVQCRPGKRAPEDFRGGGMSGISRRLLHPRMCVPAATARTGVTRIGCSDVMPSPSLSGQEEFLTIAGIQG